MRTIVKPLLFSCMFFITTNVFAQTGAASPATQNNSANSLVELQAAVLKYINAYRVSIGLKELQMIDEANLEALNHSVDMAKGTVAFGHDGFEERVNNISKKIGICMASAENVAMGMVDAEQVVKMWLNSAGHKKNIEGNYTLTGIGIARAANGYLYFTQIFLIK